MSRAAARLTVRDMPPSDPGVFAQTVFDLVVQNLLGSGKREKSQERKTVKSSKRALRRLQKARVKAKARRVYPHDRQAKSADHLAVCSCWMCGNPRKWYGETTMQERKASLDEGVL